MLLLVTALSFGLRFGAIGRLLPVRPEPDSDLVWMYRSLAGQQIPGADFYFGRYPVLWPRTLALVAGEKALAPAAPDATLEEHLEAASAPFLNLRLLMAAIAFLTAPLGFFLARRWMSDGWALLVAALLATALLHVAHSSVSKAHAAHVTLAWITILLVLRQLEAPSLARILATTVVAVLAIGTFHTGFFVLLPMFAAACLSRPTSRVVFWSAFAAVPIAFLGGLVFTPGGLTVGAHAHLWDGVQSEGIQLGNGHALLLKNFTGEGLLKWPQYFWEHDPLLAICSAIGLVVMLHFVASTWRDHSARRRVLIVSAYVLPYLVLISLDRNVVDRYLLPLYPLFVLLAVVAARAIFAALPGTPARVFACLALLALPTYVAVRFTLLGRRPDTFEQLASWIEKQPGATSKKILLSPAMAPRLFPTQSALTNLLADSRGRSQPWFEYLGRLAHLPTNAVGYDFEPLAPALYDVDAEPSPESLTSYFDSAQPDWIVLEVSRRISVVPATAAVYTRVRQRGKLIATFSGEPEVRALQTPFDYQGARNLEQRVLSAEAFGPRLEVWSMK